MLIGIDWGGTKIEAIALDAAGATLARKRVPTRQHDYEGCIAAAAGLVREMEAALFASPAISTSRARPKPRMVSARCGRAASWRA